MGTGKVEGSPISIVSSALGPPVELPIATISTGRDAAFEIGLGLKAKGFVMIEGLGFWSNCLSFGKSSLRMYSGSSDYLGGIADSVVLAL